MAVDALNLDGSAHFLLDACVAMRILDEMAIDTVHALFQVNIHVMQRHPILVNAFLWWQVLEARAMNEAKPINPQRVFWELSSRLPDNCIIVADSGSAANWFARDLKVRRGMMA